MKEFLRKLSASLDNHSTGFSGRKLTALTSVLTAIYVTCKLPEDMLLHALYSWEILALLCLGIITAEQVIKLKNGGEEKDKQALKNE